MLYQIEDYLHNDEYYYCEVCKNCITYNAYHEEYVNKIKELSDELDDLIYEYITGKIP